MGLVLVYCSPHNPTHSLPDLIEHISTAVLRSSRLLLLGDFNIHAEKQLTGANFKFRETMAGMGLSEHATGSHLQSGVHTRTGKGWSESGEP